MRSGYEISVFLIERGHRVDDVLAPGTSAAWGYLGPRGSIRRQGHGNTRRNWIAEGDLLVAVNSSPGDTPFQTIQCRSAQSSLDAARSALIEAADLAYQHSKVG